jgi:oligopeptide transport system ATP-binding protein
MPHRDERRRGRLEPIEGSPPDLFSPPAGCPYVERCPWAMKVCGPNDPPLWTVQQGHAARCWLHHVNAASRRPERLFRGALMPEGTAA